MHSNGAIIPLTSIKLDLTEIRYTKAMNYGRAFNPTLPPLYLNPKQLLKVPQYCILVQYIFNISL